MKHLKVAVDNLREAGMPEMADRLWQQGQAILEGRPMGGRMMGPPPAGASACPGWPRRAPMGTQGMPPHAPGMPGQPPPGTPMMPGMALPRGLRAGPGTGGTADGHAARDGRRDEVPRRSIAPRPGDLPGAVTAVAGADPAIQRQMEECARLRTRDQPRPRDEARPREKGETRQTREQPQPRRAPKIGTR